MKSTIIMQWGVYQGRCDMDFIDQIKELSIQISEQLEYVKNEEATKTALVMPFIRTLGYDNYNLKEVMPEYTCDAPGKNGEKVDYAIMKGEKPFMLVECKFAHNNLQDKYADQLHRYFNSIPDLKVGVLTNGVIYKFYTDLERVNIMDKTPFLEIDMRNVENNLVKELKRFRKDSPFDEDEMREAAEELDRSNKIKKIWEGALDYPSDEFVIFFARQISSDKTIAKDVIDKVRNSIKKILKEFVDKNATNVPKPIIEIPDGEGSGGKTPPKPDPIGIVTTEEEMRGFNIVREILQEIIDPDRIKYKDWKTYCNVLLDNNSTKQICRFYFNKNKKYIGLFGSNGEERMPIDDLDDIHNYADKLKATTDYYDGRVDLKTIQLEFWNGFKEYVPSKTTSLRLKHKTRPQHWYTVSLGRSKAHIDLSVNTKSNLLACEIYIPDSKELFNELIKHKDEIEDELNEELEWMELPDKTASRIKISKTGNIKEPDKRREQFEWFETQAELFQKVFPKYIK